MVYDASQLMAVKLALLDRDGIINRERGDHTWLPSDFELLRSGLDAVEALVDQGYKVAVITNQSGVGLGKYGLKEVHTLFNIISDAWKERGVDSFLPLFCPHHPSAGKCLCRKPGSLLLERAVVHFGANPSNTFFVGDRERDVEAGIRAGVDAYLLESNGDLHQLLVQKGKLNG